MAIMYDDFIKSVEKDNVGFVNDLHKVIIDVGCKIEIKEAKSGYLVTYFYTKGKSKIALMNYVFRKSGMLARIYARHIDEYQEVLDSLPDDMKKSVRESGDCKRLNGISECSPTCTAGYDFILDSTRYMKCKNGAFFWKVNTQSTSYIKTIIERELSFI